MDKKMVTIGKIVSPFGLEGAVKVYPYSDYLERCYFLKKVKIEGEKVSEIKEITKASIYKKMWVFYFKDCRTREEAQRLKNSLVKIPFKERIPLPEGAYYFDQIIGLEAVTVKGERLGFVCSILKTGGNDVYVIKRGDGNNSEEFLIPALKNVVKEINLEKGYILINPLPGLLE